MPKRTAVLLTHIRQLLTLNGPATPRRGAELSNLGIIEDGAVLCAGGKIVSVGTTQDAHRDSWYKRNKTAVREIDCNAMVVIPGFVDAHTHPVFTKPRLIDFEQRIAGATYEQIAEAGGGIRSSVEGTRKSSKNALTERVLSALNEMAQQGTTTVEAKTGYGLSVESELKSLEVLREASRKWPGTIIPTLLGAHVAPKEMAGRSQDYIDLVCKEMIPEAARRKLATFVDVFCDRGAFSQKETAQIFAAAVNSGLSTRAHICQLANTPVSELLKYNPASFDHLDHVTDEDVSALAASDTIATLVPGANYFLGLENYPPARKLIDAGVAVALATDYNPGSSPTPSMPMVLSLACTHLKMSPAEAVAAATINGAHSLRVADRKGSLEPGKDADLAAFELHDYREIPYWFGAQHCGFTMLNGTLMGRVPAG